MFAKDIMTSPVVSIKPETSYLDAMVLLTSKRISGTPVTDEAGVLIGVISLYDILNAIQDLMNNGKIDAQDPDFVSAVAQTGMHVDGMTNDRVSGFMTRNVVTVKPDTSIKDIATLMVKNRFHRVIVTDDAHKPVGIISTLDLVKLL